MKRRHLGDDLEYWYEDVYKLVSKDNLGGEIIPVDQVVIIDEYPF